jgi:hypothetical protein
MGLQLWNKSDDAVIPFDASGDRMLHGICLAGNVIRIDAFNFLHTVSPPTPQHTLHNHRIRR